MGLRAILTCQPAEVGVESDTVLLDDEGVSYWLLGKGVIVAKTVQVFSTRSQEKSVIN